MMTTNMKEYIEENNEEELGKVFRDTMEGRFQHDLYNKSFSNQLESVAEIDTLQQRVEKGMVVVNRRGPGPNDVYDYTFGDLYMLCRKAIDPETEDLVKTLIDSEIIP